MQVFFTHIKGTKKAFSYEFDPPPEQNFWNLAQKCTMYSIWILFFLLWAHIYLQAFEINWPQSQLGPEILNKTFSNILFLYVIFAQKKHWRVVRQSASRAFAIGSPQGSGSFHGHFVIHRKVLTPPLFRISSTHSWARGDLAIPIKSVSLVTHRTPQRAEHTV